MNIGVDLVKISRFKNIDKLSKKILSNKKLFELEKSTNKMQYLASRFALKEAFLKSIKKGILEIELKEINVIKEESGAIHILYDNKEYPCSLSHEDEYCIGVVLNA